jgi:hypothetical protein
MDHAATSFAIPLSLPRRQTPSGAERSRQVTENTAGYKIWNHLVRNQKQSKKQPDKSKKQGTAMQEQPVSGPLNHQVGAALSTASRLRGDTRF